MIPSEFRHNTFYVVLKYKTDRHLSLPPAMRDKNLSLDTIKQSTNAFACTVMKTEYVYFDKLFELRSLDRQPRINGEPHPSESVFLHFFICYIFVFFLLVVQ